jgi:peroxiredoxin Q/BCP
MLNEGDRAPGFSARSSEGGEIGLADLTGKKVVLYFYPKDHTSGCTREACAFRDNMGRAGRKGAVVLGVSRDSLESHDSFAHKHDLNFPLLSDPEGKIVSSYGAWKEKRKKSGEKTLGINRSTFLIDSNGVIRRIWRNVKVDGHVDEVMEALEALS